MQEGLCRVRTFIWLLIQAAGLTIVLFLANLTNFSWYLICQFADHDTPSIALSLARLSWSFSIFPFADHYTVYNTVSSIHPQFFFLEHPWSFNFHICRSRYTLTLQNMESHERLKSGFMVKYLSIVYSVKRILPI